MREQEKEEEDEEFYDNDALLSRTPEAPNIFGFDFLNIHNQYYQALAIVVAFSAVWLIWYLAMAYIHTL